MTTTPDEAGTGDSQDAPRANDAPHANGAPQGGGAPRVAVRGEARLEVEPETARIGVTVGARGGDRRAALKDLTKRNNAVLELLRSYGESVERIETGAFSISPELKTGRGERVRAYHGKVHVQAVFGDFTALGEVTTRLANLDLTSVAGPWWALRPDSPVHRRARQEAVRQAVVRAREYAEAVGAELAGLIDIADVGTDWMEPEVARGTAAPAGYGAAPGAPAAAPPALDLEPRRQTVYARINARFTITQPVL
ncbi:SIMPL domain-containing protein [Streptomyces triticirhizae]|uniref:SIMPL domain-containing protein n=1 Tax=Streptomyces triticirhizae TaxID=2483353 RepID=A0A3M2LR25_9ACTN|nr:SIMPL domain-containing protein [Streptomyces triticirhizae]RMI39536.1 SIMPL domain-containing protein [Streptomyces triticirhizae]